MINEERNIEIESEETLPQILIDEWLKAVSKELGIDNEREGQQSERSLGYFDINALESKGLGGLKRWVIQQGLKRYQAIEEHRYDKIMMK